MRLVKEECVGDGVRQFTYELVNGNRCIVERREDKDRREYYEIWLEVDGVWVSRKVFGVRSVVDQLLLLEKEYIKR